jgi:hypothetical protein
VDTQAYKKTENSHVHGLEGLILLNVHSTQRNQQVAILIKILMTFFTEIEKNSPKINLQLQKIQGSQNNPE